MGTRNGIIGKVRFSAEYLWAWRDLGFVLSDLHIYLSDLFFEAPVYLGASEIHLCADMVGYDFAASDWQHGFIRRSAFTPHFQDYTFVEEPATREGGQDEENDEDEPPCIAGPDKLHMRYRPITGFTFGSHRSAVSAVVYNKSNYIKYKAKTSTWFHALWREAGWDGEAEVWRVELRLKRPALHEAEIDSTYDLVKQLAGIWQYGTQEWLRYAVPGSDSNRTRWQVHEAWLVVQLAYRHALAPEQVDMGPIVRDHKRVANMQQLVAQIVGCLITLRAWSKAHPCSDDEDISEVLHDFYPRALNYLDKRQKREEENGGEWDYPKEVRYKQALYSQAAAA